MREKVASASAIILALNLAACGSAWVMRSQLAVPVQHASGIAVVVYDETAKGGGPLKLGGASAEHPIVEFMSATLIEKGFTVRTLDLDQMVPGPFQDWVTLPDGYWEVQAGDKGEVDVENPLKDLEYKSYYSGAAQRLNDLSVLVNAEADTWGVEYLMAVYKIGMYSYVVDVVALREKKIAFTFMFSGNKDGWNEKFPKPPTGTPGRDVSPDNASDWMIYMQLADMVCSMF